MPSVPRHERTTLELQMVVILSRRSGVHSHGEIAGARMPTASSAENAESLPPFFLSRCRPGVKRLA